MTRKTTRRRFIGQSAAIGAGFWIGGQAVAKAQDSPLQALSAACVGVGGKGGSDTSHIGEQGVCHRRAVRRRRRDVDEEGTRVPRREAVHRIIAKCSTNLVTRSTS